MTNNTNCPIKCFNMNCTNREYKKCKFFQECFKEYCVKTTRKKTPYQYQELCTTKHKKCIHKEEH